MNKLLTAIKHIDFCLIVALSCSLVATTGAPACGINWTEPENYFKGVDFQGRVQVVKTLAHLDLGKELDLPLFLTFNSGNNLVSPYGGASFNVPFLESRMVAIDQNTFRLDQPDGWFRLFWRDKKDPAILAGQGGWKGEIKGDLVTVWADCGSKIVLSRGHILQLQLKDRKFDYVYSGEKVTEVLESGKQVLKVESDPSTGEVAGLSLGMGKTIGFKWGTKPKIQTINGKNLVTGMDKALTKITYSDGTEESFEFEVDGQINPTLKINGKRTIAWDPSTKNIFKDGDWTYHIKPGEGQFASAAIERVNIAGQREFHDVSSLGGSETLGKIDGSTDIFSKFGSGILDGKLRSITKISAAGDKIETRYIYDENGHLVRSNEGDEISQYDSKGKLLTVTKGGTIIVRCVYDAKTGVLSEFWRFGERIF